MVGSDVGDLHYEYNPNAEAAMSRTATRCPSTADSGFVCVYPNPKPFSIVLFTAGDVFGYRDGNFRF